MIAAPSITWTQLAVAIARIDDSTITIQLSEQSPPAPRALAGSFRVTAESPAGLLYDGAGMDEFYAQVAFDANIKLARLKGYTVAIQYFDRP